MSRVHLFLQDLRTSIVIARFIGHWGTVSSGDESPKIPGLLRYSPGSTSPACCATVSGVCFNRLAA